jgi:hypothetical protein
VKRLILSAVACLCFLTGCSEQKDSSKSSPASSSGNPITAPADYVGAVGKAHKSAQSTLSAVGLDQAIKAFIAEEGRTPQTLQELVTNGNISELPKPPYGMKFDYNPQTGTVKVIPE